MIARGSVKTAVLTALFAFVVHAGVIAVKIEAHSARTLLAVFRVGGLQTHRPAFVAEEGYPLEEGGYGTDGQQYLFIAHDPLARSEEIRRGVDAPRYRYGRIVLPALAAVTCGGNSFCIPRAIVAYNLLFAAGIGAVVALLVARRRRHWAWGLLLSCTGALVCATDIANVELCAEFFGIFGVLLYEENALAAAASAFALAVLGRETYALVPAGFALAALVGRRPREALVFASSVIPAVAWAAYLRVALPSDPGTGAMANIAVPFQGILGHVIDFFRNPTPTGSTVVCVLVGGPLLVMLARHVMALRRDLSGLSLATALFGVLAAFASGAVWLRAGGFARGLDFLYPGIVLCALSRGDRITSYLALSTLVQSINLVAAHLVSGE